MFNKVNCHVLDLYQMNEVSISTNKLLRDRGLHDLPKLLGYAIECISFWYKYI